MNNKLLLGAVALVVIVGAFVLIGGKGTSTPAPPSISPTQKSEQPATASPIESKGTTVTITSSGFEPQTVTIKVGEKVVWMNKSGGVANVNSAVHPTHQVFPPLNLGQVADGSSLELIFDKAGTYKYHNHLDASQTGTVVVE